MLPGGPAERSRKFEPGTNVDLPCAVVRFTGAAGVRLLRTPDSELTEQQYGRPARAEGCARERLR
jgi:hypothetical protein